MKYLSDRLGFIRFYAWWNYKLPPLFGIAFFFILYNGLPFGESLKRLAVLIVCMIGTAGFGHYLNDLFDIETDHLSGKKNISAQHSPARKVFTLMVLLITGLMPWFIFFDAGTIHLLVMAVFILFALYSVPPVRLKDRGFPGIFSDALYAHAIPSVIVSLAMLEGSEMNDKMQILVLMVFAWQFFVGFRNIAFHQFEDYEQDRLGGAKTWALSLGAEKIKKLSLNCIYPAEAVSHLAFLFALLHVSVLAGALLIVLIILRLYVYLFIYEKGYLADWKNYFSFVNNSNEEDIPLALLVCLTLANPWFVLILALYCVLFPQFILRMQENY